MYSTAIYSLFTAYVMLVFLCGDVETRDRLTSSNSTQKEINMRITIRVAKEAAAKPGGNPNGVVPAPDQAHDPSRILPWAMRLDRQHDVFSSDAVFVCRDAGETLAFIATMKLLAIAGWDVVGLALTANAATLLHNAGGLRVLTLPDLGVRQSLRRDDTLSLGQLHAIQEALQDTTRLVTGLVSAVQLQLAQNWRGARVMGYDDGFALWRNDTYAARFLQSSTDAMELMVTSRIIARESQPRHHAIVSVVGQPTLAAWNATAHNIAAANALRRRLAVHRPVFAFFGGYGSRSYNQSIEVLADAIQRGDILTEFEVFITPHPGQGGAGAVEEAILRSRGVKVRRIGAVARHPQTLLQAAVAIVEPAVANSSSIAAIANVTASVDSTCGLQSLAVGKPSVYVDHNGNFSDVATFEGLIPVVKEPGHLVQFLADAKAAGFKFDPRKLEEAGIPAGAAALMTAHVEAPHPYINQV